MSLRGSCRWTSLGLASAFPQGKVCGGPSMEAGVPSAPPCSPGPGTLSLPAAGRGGRVREPHLCGDRCPAALGLGVAGSPGRRVAPPRGRSPRTLLRTGSQQQDTSLRVRVRGSISELTGAAGVVSSTRKTSKTRPPRGRAGVSGATGEAQNLDIVLPAPGQGALGGEDEQRPSPVSSGSAWVCLGCKRRLSWFPSAASSQEPRES